jgi:cholesterol transport system auxiliary component
MALSVLLTACALSRSTEGPVHTFLLKMEEGTWAAPSSGEKPASHGILLISLPQADPGFDTPRMVYLTRPYEVRYYTANQWADTPPRMLVSLLTYSMEKSGFWQTVVSSPASIRGDYRLDTQGLILQQEFIQQPSQVRLALRVQLIEQREQKVIGSKRIEIVEKAPSEDAYGGVVAANRAVTKLLDQVAVWVRGCVSGEQECNR